MRLGGEIDRSMAEYMRAQGKNVIHADFAISDVSAFMPDNVKAEDGFDVVHFTQVFEHVVKPAQFLANACLALIPVAIETDSTGDSQTA